MCRRRVAERVANPGEIVHGVADALPVADSSYDVAYAIETVYFWPDLCAGLREMRRVLKGGGVAAVSVECFDPARAGVWRDLVGGMEVRTPEQIAQAFLDAGFDDVSISQKGENRPTWCGVACVIGHKPRSSP